MSIRLWFALPALLFLAVMARADESFVVAVNNNDRPFCWTGERGELTGFSVDVARALCRRMEAECRFVPVTFADFIPGVAARRFDFVVANVLRTAEREKLVAFSRSYWRSSSMFLGTPAMLREATRATLQGRHIGVQKGSVQEKYLLEHFADVAVVKSYATNVERNQALVAGSVDLIFGSTVSHFAFMSTPEGARFDFIGSPIEGQGLGGDVAIPLAKGREDLRQRLDAAIEAILRDGSFAAISNAYFNTNPY